MDISAPATSADLDSLWKQWKQTKDMSARNRLIEHYLGLVEYVTSRMAIGLPRTVSKDDLTSYGIMGLIDALDKFELERSLQFETYASWRIRGSIIDGLRQTDWVPRSVREKARKIEEAYQKLEQENLRSVSDKEISEYLQISEDQFQQMLQEVSGAAICSLEEPLREEETENRLSLLVDEKGKHPEDSVKDLYLKDILAKALDRLTEKERTVISLFYYEDLSLSEIAEVMSLSPSRISQLHSKAILRLRGNLSRAKEQLMQH